MKGERNARAVAALGWSSAFFAVLSTVLFGIAMGFDPGAGSDLVERLPAVEASDADLIRWGALADALGYYLLPAALTLVIRRRLSFTGPWGDLVAAAAVVYGAAGGLAAVVLATAGAPLIEGGSNGDLQILETLARGVLGVWQWFDPVPFTLWAAGIALALRSSRGPYAVLFACLALGGALVLAGRLVNAEPVLVVGLALWLAPFPVAMATAPRWAGEGDRP